MQSFTVYHTPREYNQSCNGKHLLQNVHSSQLCYFLHLAYHTASCYLPKILADLLFNYPKPSNYQRYSYVFISRILDTVISKSCLVIGHSRIVQETGASF